MSDYIDADRYVFEKSLLSLQSAVQLVDLVLDPKTEPWYKRKLGAISESMIGRLLPLVVFSINADPKALEPEEIRKITSGGSFALAKWCKTWSIEEPPGVAFGALRHLEVVEDDEGFDATTHAKFEGTEEERSVLKFEIYSAMTGLLVHDEFPEPARKFLLWLLRGLWRSDEPDVVEICKNFLPTDLRVSAENAANAYRFLFEKRLIERVPNETADVGFGDRMKLRLIVQGLNEPRHEQEFEEVEFGFFGSRINGEPSIGDKQEVSLSAALDAKLRWLLNGEQDLVDLKTHIQTSLGEATLFVDHAQVEEKHGKRSLSIQFRYPISGNVFDVKQSITKATREWLTARDSMTALQSDET